MQKNEIKPPSPEVEFVGREGLRFSATHRALTAISDIAKYTMVLVVVSGLIVGVVYYSSN